ncbi:adenylyl-sulfate kinase [Roseateles saccharophilus]|uniref:adenylyl-sulfate kinase n=1 Tax=Roseateles saccharophilus TaxID=304 RepID=UPI00104F5E4B|nr:adenylyl-sulfate kinase [Roseateles saccharophilus]MDG0833486.1 adenylyl-sulfate kinase [Roseateles saccharophilus]
MGNIQIGTCYRLTGLPGAGKTTLASACRRRLKSEGRDACVLVADVLREGINRHATDRGQCPGDRGYPESSA